MAIEWTPDLATGVDLIDEQHKELFRRIDALLEACMRGEGGQTVSQTLDYLAWYVIEHFDTEEEVMRRANYAGLAKHEALHKEFRNNIAELKLELEANGSGPHIVVKVNRLVVAWLNAHIRKVDTAMAANLKREFAAVRPGRA